MNVTLEPNGFCILNPTESFLSVLAQFQTHRLNFQEKSMTLILGNHSALYSSDRPA